VWFVLVFLGAVHTNNEQIKKEIRKTIPFTTASKSVKYLGINLMNETKDLFNENYKPLKREIEDITRWKDLQRIGRINIVKIAILPKAFYMFNTITTKIPVTFCTKIEKSIWKYIWKHKRSNIQSNSEQKLQCCRHHNT
jgi:hypothetical protein